MYIHTFVLVCNNIVFRGCNLRAWHILYMMKDEDSWKIWSVCCVMDSFHSSAQNPMCMEYSNARTVLCGA